MKIPPDDAKRLVTGIRPLVINNTPPVTFSLSVFAAGLKLLLRILALARAAKP
ncbi:MAG TPA: hypothetical protein VJ842_09540 [Pyrinomonadaceae bacterium]|nr:hypothetical protein [Pyrinomonadaceae bacterium]